MAHIVVKLTGTHIKPGSVAALPKTMFVAGTRYARIEDAPDARMGTQKLIIIAEPNAYSINLIDKKGTRSTDNGGGKDLHVPIILPFDPMHHLGILDKLEFGSELDFFEQAGATKQAGPIINAKPTDEYVVHAGGATATLVVKPETETPVLLTWNDPTDGEFRYEYIIDEEKPFDPALFQPPAGVHWRTLPADGQGEQGQ